MTLTKDLQYAIKQALAVHDLAHRMKPNDSRRLDLIHYASEIHDALRPLLPPDKGGTTTLEMMLYKVFESRGFTFYSVSATPPDAELAAQAPRGRNVWQYTILVADDKAQKSPPASPPGEDSR